MVDSRTNYEEFNKEVKLNTSFNILQYVLEMVSRICIKTFSDNTLRTYRNKYEVNKYKAN